MAVKPADLMKSKILSHAITAVVAIFVSTAFLFMWDNHVRSRETPPKKTDQVTVTGSIPAMVRKTPVDGFEFRLQREKLYAIDTSTGRNILGVDESPNPEKGITVVVFLQTNDRTNKEREFYLRLRADGTLSWTMTTPSGDSVYDLNGDGYIDERITIEHGM